MVTRGFQGCFNSRSGTLGGLETYLIRALNGELDRDGGDDDDDPELTPAQMRKMYKRAVEVGHDVPRRLSN